MNLPPSQTDELLAHCLNRPHRLPSLALYWLLTETRGKVSDSNEIGSKRKSEKADKRQILRLTFWRQEHIQVLVGVQWWKRD
jgi:hypothetical protein